MSEHRLSNSRLNTTFLAAIGTNAANAVLDAMARHYGITREDARAELTDEEAEMVLDYLPSQERAAASVLMQRHGLAAH